MKKTIEDKLMRLSRIYNKKEPVEFEWNLQNGLRYVSDQSLELAYEILKKADISLKKEDDKIHIINNIVNLCNYQYTTDTLLKELLNNNLLKKDKTVLEVYDTNEINQVCYKCKFQKCPKHLAGYIYYLMKKGVLEKKLEERIEFRRKNEVNDVYAFTWNYGNIIKMIPDEVYDFCYKLVENDQIYVKKHLVNNKSIEIVSQYSCSEYQLMNCDIAKIKKEIIPYEEWRKVKRNPDLPVELCNAYICDTRGCPYVIAGIIQYLINSGKKEVLEEEREFYRSNKRRMDIELNEIIEEANKNKKNRTKKIFEKMKDYKDSLANFEDLISLLKNKNQKSLHCIIEGNDTEERKEFIDTILKILDKSSRRISMQNLTVSNTYYREDDKGAELIKHKKLEENEVYVINNLGEFVRDYKKFKNVNIDYLHGELRKKQYEYIINLLTEINYSNYIILEGTDKEVNEFLKLEPKLQYIYQNSIFKIAEISLDEAYELYLKKLDNNIIKEIVNNEEEYKKQFMEYISLNKNFIPFNNRELASYLAMYSNSKGKVEFPDNIYKKETIDETLKNVVGLQNVKKKLKEFEKYMLFKAKADAKGLKLTNSNMHMIFTGNPGTGKTTIARIMAKMLYDMGIIKENKLIEVERKDLVAGYVGQTAIKTSEIISKAIGGILFIDEAYSLAIGSGNDFGNEAIATLIKAMEDHKEEMVVIFAGYKGEMKKFLDMNPGISSRIGYNFDFQNYTIEELQEMFYKKIKNMGFSCKEECDLELKKVFSYFSTRKDFGNGRFVDKLIQETIMKHAISKEENVKEITAKDIPTIREFSNSTELEESTKDMLKQIIGLEELKEKINEFETYVKFIKEAEKSNIKIPKQNMHMIFTGNAGTGKTTIARIMVKILYNAGIIQENKLVEVERKDLIAGYVGQTAIKTYEVIEKALGGVLFIDEAYSLTESNSSNDFGGEAIATLIKAMEEHKGEFVVIFAGYKEKMGNFINTNPGIASRIGYIFDFKDYNREELAQILYKKIENSNLLIENNAKNKVLEIMNYFCSVENIGNGRFVDKVFQEIILNHAKNKDAEINVIKEEDIPTIKEMTESLFNGDKMINPEKISDKDLKETAIHEIGHAIMQYKLYKTSGIIKITINPEGGGTLGYVKHKITEGKYVSNKSTLLKEIKVALAGMASEEVFIGEFSNGNVSDLKHATRIAKNMVTRYGMSELGFAQIEDATGELYAKVQEEVNKILLNCYKDALEIIKANKENVQNLVEILMEEKELTEEKFIEILGQRE